MRRAFALAALVTLAAAGASADELCPAAGSPVQAEAVSRRLASADGAGTPALGAFVDHDTIYVLMPRGPTVVVPPDIAALYRGQVPSDSATVLIFAATPAAIPGGRTGAVWTLDTGLVIVPGAAVSGVTSFAHRDRSYVFLAGDGRHPAPTCLAPGVTLLPSVAGIALRTALPATTAHAGSEAVIEAGGRVVLISPCCAERPEPHDPDPRRVLDAAAFTRHVEGERFFGPGGWRGDWTAAALDAHARLRAGDLDEARAALGDVRRRLGERVSPLLALLHDLLEIGRSATGALPAAGAEATIREERARLQTAHAIVKACRARDFSILRRQRLAFVEVLPPPETLPPPLAARLALCEAEYLLALGEPRAALARLRSPDAPNEGAAAVHRLILDAAALRRAGQAELARFAEARLAEGLDDPAGPPDLRAVEAHLRGEGALDAELVLRLVLDRQRTFGDYRLDFRLVSGAVSSLAPEALVERLDGLQAFAARAPEPALTLALHRLAARRIVAALAAGDPHVAARNLAALDFIRQAAGRREFADFRRDLTLAHADLALHAGLGGEAGAALGAALAAWPAGEPIDDRHVAWLERLLRRYGALRDSESADGGGEDLLGAMRPANDALAAMQARVRHDRERDAVAAAVPQKDAWETLTAAERQLFERMRTLRLTP